MFKIKDILKEANRYEDIKSILEKIISDDRRASHPVNAFVDEHGNTQWRVDAGLVREEAAELLSNIENDTKSGIKSNLVEYTMTHSNMLLHNYAVHVSHRKEPKEDAMDEIRNWLILENLLMCWSDDDWDIPDGWKKIL